MANGESIVFLNSIVEFAMMTSRLMSEMGSEQGVYSPEVKHVELWINAVYQGLYQAKRNTQPIHTVNIKVGEGPIPSFVLSKLQCETHCMLN